MKTLYFGGSFNPIHIGHLLSAQFVAEALGIDRVVIVPAMNPYHKNVGMESYENRLFMCRLAVTTMQLFKVSDIERFIGEAKSYTFDTLNRLTDGFREKPLYLIGMDNALAIHDWYKFDELKKHTNFVIVTRGSENLPMNLKYKYTTIKGPTLDISSTEIRKRIKEHKSITHLVPPMVEHFIASEGLYESK